MHFLSKLRMSIGKTKKALGKTQKTKKNKKTKLETL
jgi:hypothetical protein